MYVEGEPGAGGNTECSSYQASPTPEVIETACVCRVMCLSSTKDGLWSHTQNRCIHCSYFPCSRIIFPGFEGVRTKYVDTIEVSAVPAVSAELREGLHRPLHVSLVSGECRGGRGRRRGRRSWSSGSRRGSGGSGGSCVGAYRQAFSKHTVIKVRV